jgi:septal ring factor EnvC (AmiA/AmiB activator)
MNAPTYDNRISPATILALANLALLLIGGGTAYGTLRAELDATRSIEARITNELASIRSDAAGQEARIRAVELGFASATEKLNNIEAGIARIERQLTNGNGQ